MSNIREQYRAVVQAKTPRAFFGNIPRSFIELLAAVPAAALFLTVPYQILVTYLAPYGYAAATVFAGRIGTFLGGAALLLLLGKKCTDGTQVSALCRRNLPLLCFCAAMLLMVFSTYLNGFTYAALHGDLYRHESLFTYLLYFGIYYTTASVISAPRVKKLLLYTFLAAAFLLNSAVVIETYVRQTKMFFAEHTIGIFHQYNHYGYFLTVTVVLSAALTLLEKTKPLRIFAFLSFLLGSASLVLNGTFGCYLACIAGLLFLTAAVSLCRRKFSPGALVLLGILLLVTAALTPVDRTIYEKLFRFRNDVSGITSGSAGNTDEAGTGRWGLWRVTLGEIREHPLIGSGIEGIADILIASSVFHTDRPHNEYLQYAAFFGIPTLIAYLCGLFFVFRSALKHRAKTDACSLAALCAAFAYLVSACFGNTMYYTAPYLFLFLGLSFRTGSRKDETL